ncbi:MAG: multicopper oxidase family protein [Gemmatimonadota bacterium]|nr:multicopper oxidase family protein [Gemmatimonadota bacterium]
MRRTGTEALRRFALLLALLGSTVAPLTAQHEHHQGMTMSGDPAAWRMPPMDPNMPMLPGLETALPPVAPFLLGTGLDPESFPEARPSEMIDVQAGDTVDMEVSIVRRTIAGQSYLMYGYDGQYPGPLLRAPQGTTVVVRLTNNIEMPTTVHWHGVRLDNRFDGVPGLTQPPVAPGETFLYEVKVTDAGIYWYHPHVLEYIQQDLGLYGNLLVDSPDPDYYGPAHRQEMLVLDDVLIDEQGLIPWGESTPTHALMGRFGTVMLVNGTTEYGLDVDRGEVVRFFLTNVANTRTFNVVFGGARVKIVASDVGRYEQEQWVESVVIAPAERYVVDVRFEESGPVAITNSIQAVNHFRGEFYPHVDTLGTVRVGAGAASPDLGQAFGTLRSHPDVIADIERFRAEFDREPDHELELTVRVQDLPNPIVQSMLMDTLYVPPVEWNDAMPMMNWLSTGAQVTWIMRDPATGLENMDIDWSFTVGDVVKIRIFNDPKSFHPMQHPFHIHGQRFLVVSRDGVPADNLVWKDTAVVPVGSTVDFLVDITNPGDWMMHCHISEHLEAGMMGTFHVQGG